MNAANQNRVKLTQPVNIIQGSAIGLATLCVLLRRFPKADVDVLIFCILFLLTALRGILSLKITHLTSGVLALTGLGILLHWLPNKPKVGLLVVGMLFLLGCARFLLGLFRSEARLAWGWRGQKSMPMSALGHGLWSTLAGLGALAIITKALHYEQPVVILMAAIPAVLTALFVAAFRDRARHRNSRESRAVPFMP